MLELLESYGKKGVAMLQELVPKVTGKTARSIRYEATEDRLTIFGRAAFGSLETGRGPRRSTEYSEFDRYLEDWLRAKGFQTKQSKSGVRYYKINDVWFSAKSLAWKINKQGDTKHRHGVEVEIYQKAMDDFKEKLTKAVAKEKYQELKKQVLAEL